MGPQCGGVRLRGPGAGADEPDAKDGGSRSHGRQYGWRSAAGTGTAGAAAPPCVTARAEALRDACAAAGFSPDFSVASQDHATAQGFVGDGMGIGLMPLMGLRNRHPDVVLRKLRKPEPIRVIRAAIRDTAPSRPALQGFVDAVREAATGRLFRPVCRGMRGLRSGALAICERSGEY
ncbi:LysR substrate-binding domain-containing protein [Streptomyces sp. NPDC055400]